MRTSQNEQGFTLLELLTCVVIVGILVAITCRQISVYQARSFNARAEHDLRTALAAEEDYFGQNETYVECEDSACEELLQSFKLSQGTKITVEASSDGLGYRVVAYHPRGDKVYRFDSEIRGIIDVT